MNKNPIMMILWTEITLWGFMLGEGPVYSIASKTIVLLSSYIVNTYNLCMYTYTFRLITDYIFRKVELFFIHSKSGWAIFCTKFFHEIFNLCHWIFSHEIGISRSWTIFFQNFLLQRNNNQKLGFKIQT